MREIRKGKGVGQGEKEKIKSNSETQPEKELEAEARSWGRCKICKTLRIEGQVHSNAVERKEKGTIGGGKQNL